jgi:hypothetical protein
MEAQRCPACGYILDAHENIHGTGAPERGDFTVCLGCAAILCYREQMRLTEASLLELADLHRDDPKGFTLVLRLQDSVKEIKLWN